MAKRFTDTELWGKEFFLKYSMKQKLLLRYLYDSCDNAGIYEPNYILLEVFIGEKITEADILSLNTDKKRIVKLENGNFYLTRFIKFQQGDFLNPKNNAHKQIIAILKENRVRYNNILAPDKGVASPYEAPSKPLNSPLLAPDKGVASPPSNSNSNNTDTDTTYLTDNNFKKENKIKEKNLNESNQFFNPLLSAKKNVEQCYICDGFNIDFDNDPFFKPYANADSILRQSLNSWLVKNHKNQMVDKNFICQQITNFAKRQGKWGDLLGIPKNLQLGNNNSNIKGDEKK
jgi:hypothetical protein